MTEYKWFEFLDSIISLLCAMSAIPVGTIVYLLFVHKEASMENKKQNHIFKWFEKITITIAVLVTFAAYIYIRFGYLFFAFLSKSR